jgi:hypothetical protein
MTTNETLSALRFRLALQLHDDGVRLMRQNLRRRHPAESDDEIERRLGGWLAERPGAPSGDATGKPLTWPLG